MQWSRISKMEFESSVNSYGGQTLHDTTSYLCMFESSVNSYGGQTR